MTTDATHREAIASRLRAARENAGLSQGQVARLIGYQRPTISEIEAGRRRVSTEELAKLCEIYDVSISWIATEQAEVSNPNVMLAARELAKLTSEDLDKVMHLLQTLRKSERKTR
jgi:transcriptional regulator with XRE-family HTH domain